MSSSKKIALAAAFAVGLISGLPAYAGEVAAAPAKTVAPVEAPAEDNVSFAASVGYDSLYIFRGYNLLGNRGIGYVDVNTTIYGFNVGAWFARDGGGSGEDYSEIDLYAGYTYDFGPVAVTAGYIYYKFPEAEADAEETQEVYATLSTNVIPYVTPTLSYYYDFDLFEGGYLELKFASSFPVYKEMISIDPYALISYDFEYNTTDTGLNSFQFGVTVPVHFNDVVTLSGYVSMAIPLDVLDDSQDTEVWAGGKLSFSF